MGQRPRKYGYQIPRSITRDGKRYVFDEKREARTLQGARLERRSLQNQAKRQKHHGLIEGYRVPPPRSRKIRREQDGRYRPGYVVVKYVR